MIAYLLSVRQYFRVILIVFYLSCIVALSLLPPNDLPQVKLFEGFDKIVHFLMYFGLMSAIIFENKKTLKTTRNLFLISLIPLFYGILMEVLQGVLTTTRSASFFDAVSDAAGILVCILLWLRIKTFKKGNIR